MQPWKTLARRTALDMGKFLKVEVHTVQLPDGRTIPDWSWVITPDYINVTAVTTEGKFLCFRQTKYSVAGESLAVVGGYLEAGEDPLTAAQRELREETGYESATWFPLGRYPVDGNRGAGVAYPFLAVGAHPVVVITADDLEEQELLLLSRSDIETALDAGEFKLLPWALAVSLALRKLG